MFLWFKDWQRSFISILRLLFILRATNREWNLAKRYYFIYSCQTAGAKRVINGNVIFLVAYYRIDRPRYKFRRSFRKSNYWIAIYIKSGASCHGMSIKCRKNTIFLPLPRFPTISDWRPRRGNRRFIRDEKTRFSIASGLSHYERQIAVYAPICGLPCSRLYGITNIAN